MTRAADPADMGELFAAHQRSIWRLAYRMTGCAADADDVVQDTFARAVAHGPLAADASKSWLMRVAVNLAIDALRRRRRRSYVGSWLPSPVETDEAVADVDSPEARYARTESVSFAFLVALEALAPRQRAVLLLRDVFDYSSREVAEALSMSEENVRVVHHRARRAMQACDRTSRTPAAELHEQTMRALNELLRCMLTQDVAGMEALLAAEVRTITDGGGEFNALRQPMVGARRVAALHLRVAKRRAAGTRTEIRTINGLPALVIQYGTATRRQAPRAVLRCEVDTAGRITEVHVVLATRKLAAIRFDRR